MVAIAESELLRQGKIKPGDVMGVVAGTQLASGSTNFMRLHVALNGEAEKKPVKGRTRRKKL
jgi:hypothetical protein